MHVMINDTTITHPPSESANTMQDKHDIVYKKTDNNFMTYKLVVIAN